MTKPKPEDDLSSQLKAAIVASGLTYRELGERAGITHVQIVRFTSGARANITIATAGKLAKVLGLRLQ